MTEFDATQTNGTTGPTTATTTGPTDRSSRGLLVAGVRKSFDGDEVLRGVDLVAPGGELTAVLGPSGCGKTTLLRVIAGFIDPDAGTVELDGRRLAGPEGGLPPERRSVGIVPQEGALFPHLSVAGNVGYGVPRHERRERVDELLELVGLSGLGRRRPSELSGGQQHRVALARALAPRPSVVLLDEPFSSLDAGLRGLVRSEVAAVLRSTGTTAVLVTHDQGEALSMADRVAVMLDGQIAQIGTPQELYQRPSTPQVASFLGDAVLLSGIAHLSGVSTSLGMIPVEHVGPPAADGASVTVLVRPEQIDLDAPHGVAATTTAIEYHGHDTVVVVRLGNGQMIRSRHWGLHTPEVGAPVTLAVRGNARSFPTPHHP